MNLTFSITPILIAVAASSLINLLLNGAIQGMISGALAGAMIMPPMKAPDTAGRGLFFGIMLTILVAVYQIVFQVLPRTGSSAETVINGSVGSALITTLMYVTIAFFVGFVIGLLTLVPGDVIKGAGLGLLLGAIIGAGTNYLLKYMQINVSAIVFQAITGLSSAALLMSVAGSSEDEKVVRRKKKEKKRKNW